jgi:hypothetical protein
MRDFLFVGFASIFLVLLGCDGSSNGSGGHCASFTPCGGALTGTWQITGTCFELPDAGSSTSSCGSTASTANLQYKGSFTFRSDGTYSIAVSMSGSSKVTYTAECLSSFGMSCEAISSSLGGAGDAGVSGSCSSTSSGGCACAETINNVQSPEEGTYTTSGTTFVTTPSNSSSSPTTADYCVQGNRLTIGVKDSSALIMITATK